MLPISFYQSAKRNRRRGAIVVFAAFCLVIVIGFLAFTIDLGYINVTEAELQNAADASAVSGARALSQGRNEAIAAAVYWASKNIAGGKAVEVNGAVDVEIGTWDEDTANFTVLPPDSSITPDAVKVTCGRLKDRGTQLNLFFGAALGTKDINLKVSAIAQAKGSSCGGIMALEKIYLNDRQAGRASYTDSYNVSQGFYSGGSAGDNGDICTNGHLTLNGNSRVNGDARWWEQAKTPNASQSQVSGVFASFKDPIDFPPINPGDAATVNNNSSLTLSNNGVPVLIGSKFILGATAAGSPYSTSLKSGPIDSIVFPPGTYYFSEMTVGSGSRILVSGPTFIYVDGQIDLRFGGIDNITRVPANLQIYPMAADTFFYLPFFGELHASIYTTTAHIYLDEKVEPIAFDFFGKMVGQKIRVWDTGLHVDESISFGSLRSGGEQIGRSGISLVQ